MLYSELTVLVTAWNTAALLSNSAASLSVRLRPRHRHHRGCSLRVLRTWSVWVQAATQTPSTGLRLLCLVLNLISNLNISAVQVPVERLTASIANTPSISVDGTVTCHIIPSIRFTRNSWQVPPQCGITDSVYKFQQSNWVTDSVVLVSVWLGQTWQRHQSRWSLECLYIYNKNWNTHSSVSVFCFVFCFCSLLLLFLKVETVYLWMYSLF